MEVGVVGGQVVFLRGSVVESLCSGVVAILVGLGRFVPPCASGQAGVVQVQDVVVVFVCVSYERGGEGRERTRAD